MKSDLEKYLEKMSKQISNRKVREETYLEMKSHFLDKLDVLVEEGLSENEAVEQIIAEATPPKKLGRKLNIAHRPWILRYPIILGSVLLFLFSMISTIYISHHIVAQYLENSEEHGKEQYTVFIEKFKKDLQIISTSEFNYSHSRNANAHSFLKENVPLYWKDRKDHRKNKLNRFLMRYQGWLFKPEVTASLMKDVDNMGIDLTWVDQMMNFDHVSYLEDPYNVKIIRKAKNATVFDKIEAFSMVDYANVGFLADAFYVRSMQLIKKNENKLAHDLLLKSIQFSQSMGNLVGFVKASGQMRFFNHLDKTFNLGWKRFSADYILAQKRVGWGWSHLLHYNDVNGENLKEFRGYFQAKYGFCAGLAENPLGPMMFSGLFAKRLAFEPDLELRSQKYKNEALVMFKDCGIQGYSNLIDGSFERSNLFNTKIWKMVGFNNWLFINPMAIPYIRGIATAYLLNYRIQYNQVYFR